MNKKITSILSLFLILLILTSCMGEGPGNVTTTDGNTSAPIADVTTPESTTAPEATTPEDTTPAPTTPEETTTVPETTVPVTTVPVPEGPTPIEFTYESKNLAFSPSAPYAFIVDLETNTMIYTKGGMNDKIYPASVTKLLTAIVALDNCAEDVKFTVGDERTFPAYDASVAGLVKGDVLTLSDLLYGLLLPSGSDASYTIATGVGRMIANDPSLSPWAAKEVFVAEMNKYAKSIGMMSSNFTCPDGYHNNNHYSTPEDLARLCSVAATDKRVTKYTSAYTATVVLEGGKIITWKNTNALLNSMGAYYVPFANGLKTGTTDEGGYCLTASALIKGKRYLVGIFKASGTTARFKDAYDAFSLLETA